MDVVTERNAKKEYNLHNGPGLKIPCEADGGRKGLLGVSIMVLVIVMGVIMEST